MVWILNYLAVNPIINYTSSRIRRNAITLGTLQQNNVSVASEHELKTSYTIKINNMLSVC